MFHIPKINHWKEMLNTVVCSDAIEFLQKIPDNTVQTCVTSPPYWGLRDYGTPDGRKDTKFKGSPKYRKNEANYPGGHTFHARGHERWPNPKGKNRRTIWTIPTESFSGAHFATFPKKIPELCIAAGSREGNIVLDPFGGSFTTAQIARQMNRQFLTCDLSEEYCKKFEKQRLSQSVLYDFL